MSNPKKQKARSDHGINFKVDETTYRDLCLRRDRVKKTSGISVSIAAIAKSIVVNEVQKSGG